MRVLIKNGYLIDPGNSREGRFDLLLDNGVVAEVAPSLDSVNADEVIDADGNWVMPGFIDLHVHFREPGYEYKETIATGAAAAAAGGYTTVCPMPNTNPVIDSAFMVEYLKLKAEKVSGIHIIPVGAVTKGQKGEELADIEGMAAAGALALSEDGRSVMDAALYREGMKAAKKAGLAVFAHCEDKSLAAGGVMNAGPAAKRLGLPGITNAVEDVIAARDILLAKETGVRLHLCHCSTRDSVEFVRMAKEEGLSVTGEVCPHHFAMCDEEITRDDGNFKMNPPLRSGKDMEALRQGLRDGIMDVISTDHAPHGEAEKNQSMAKAPFGIVGSETAFALTVTTLVKGGYLTPMQLVEKMSLNPARILGINAGNLAPGRPADLVIADPDREYVIDPSKFCSKGRNTPFAGRRVSGMVLRTIVGGVTVYCAGE